MSTHERSAFNVSVAPSPDQLAAWARTLAATIPVRLPLLDDVWSGNPPAKALTRDGAWCVPVRRRHPLTGLVEYGLDHLAAVSTAELAALLDEVDAGVGGETALSADVYARAGELMAEVLASRGWREQLVVIDLALSERQPPPTVPGVDLVAFDPAAHSQFVMDCLVTAVGRGLGGTFDEDAVRAFCRHAFPLEKGAVVVIGEIDGQPAVHATAYPAANRFGRDRIAHVLDVMVDPRFKGKGLSDAATAALFDLLAIRGVSWVESEVVLLNGDSQRLAALRSRLSAAGWRDLLVRWIRR